VNGELPPTVLCCLNVLLLLLLHVPTNCKMATLISGFQTPLEKLISTGFHNAL
jgi:hypothetical protein